MPLLSVSQIEKLIVEIRETKGADQPVIVDLFHFTAVVGDLKIRSGIISPVHLISVFQSFKPYIIQRLHQTSISSFIEICSKISLLVVKLDRLVVKRSITENVHIKDRTITETSAFLEHNFLNIKFIRLGIVLNELAELEENSLFRILSGHSL